MTEDNKIVLEVKDPEFEEVVSESEVIDGPETIPDPAEDIPSQRRSRSIRRHVAHVPGPRRRPKFAEVQVPVAEEGLSEEEIDVGAATAEPESVSDEARASDSGHEAPQPGGWQKPMTFGSVDG